MKMMELKEEVDSTGNTTTYKDGQIVKYAGIISSIKKKYTKNNKLMAFATIEDLYGQAEVIIFENAYMGADNLLVTDNIVLVEGRLSVREDEDIKIVAREIKELLEENKLKVLKINITNLDENIKSKLRELIKKYRKEKINTSVQVINEENILDCGKIFLSKEILQEFKEVVGEDRVIYE